MYLKVQGLVLRITEYNDRDALLTVLTRDHGRLTVKARGLRRKNSPLTAACQLLAYSDFTLFEYRDMYTINEAASMELFQGLRRDLTKLSLGTYFAQVAEVVSQEDHPDPELLSLVLNCLYGLSRLDIPEDKVKAVFELRSTCIAGYLPDLSGCASCGSEDADRLDISTGLLECSRCPSMDSDGIRMPVTPGMRQAMRYIVSCNQRKLFSFELGEENMHLLSQLTEAYLTRQFERGFSTLDFYKSLYI